MKNNSKSSSAPPRGVKPRPWIDGDLLRQLEDRKTIVERCAVGADFKPSKGGKLRPVDRKIYQWFVSQSECVTKIHGHSIGINRGHRVVYVRSRDGANACGVTKRNFNESLVRLIKAGELFELGSRVEGSEKFFPYSDGTELRLDREVRGFAVVKPTGHKEGTCPCLRRRKPGTPPWDGRGRGLVSEAPAWIYAVRGILPRTAELALIVCGITHNGGTFKMRRARMARELGLRSVRQVDALLDELESIGFEVESGQSRCKPNAITPPKQFPAAMIEVREGVGSKQHEAGSKQQASGSESRQAGSNEREAGSELPTGGIKTAQSEEILEETQNTIEEPLEKTENAIPPCPPKGVPVGEDGRFYGVDHLKADGPQEPDEMSEFRNYLFKQERWLIARLLRDGATLEREGDVLTLIPRDEICERDCEHYRSHIAELATEFYGRAMTVSVAPQLAAERTLDELIRLGTKFVGRPGCAAIGWEVPNTKPLSNLHLWVIGHRKQVERLIKERDLPIEMANAAPVTEMAASAETSFEQREADEAAAPAGR